MSYGKRWIGMGAQVALLAAGLVFGLAAGLATGALAGINLDGTLILHAEPGIVYSTGQDYSGSSSLGDCASAVDSVDASATVVAYALAVFPTAEDDRLTGLTFGVDYDPIDLTIAEVGTSAGFELPTDAWPSPGEGTAVTWAAPLSGHILEVYWFAAYANYGALPTLSLAPHPTQGGMFADDSTPAELDEIVGYGILGFGVAGSTPCPPPGSVAGGTWGVIVTQ